MRSGLQGFLDLLYLSPVKSGCLYLSPVEGGCLYLSPVESGCLYLSPVEGGCLYLSPVEGGCDLSTGKMREVAGRVERAQWMATQGAGVGKEGRMAYGVVRIELIV